MKAFLRKTSGGLLMANNNETADYIDILPVGAVIEVEITENDEHEKPKKKRTLTQNAAAHLYFTKLADALNDSGRDVRSTITMPVDFTSDTVKKYMFKPIMQALYPDVKSTSKLNTEQISVVYENLNRLTADKFMISVQWPSRFNMGNLE